MASHRTLPTADEMTFGIVVSEQHASVTESLLNGAVRMLRSAGCPDLSIQVKYVPTLFDLVAGVQFFAEYTDVDAVIALGCELSDLSTWSHPELLCQSVMQSFGRITLQWNMPVANGIVVDRDLYGAAAKVERLLPGEQAAESAIRLVDIQIGMEAESPEHNPDRKKVN